MSTYFVEVTSKVVTEYRITAESEEQATRLALDVHESFDFDPSAIENLDAVKSGDVILEDLESPLVVKFRIELEEA